MELVSDTPVGAAQFEDEKPAKLPVPAVTVPAGVVLLAKVPSLEAIPTPEALPLLAELVVIIGEPPLPTLTVDSEVRTLEPL